MRNTPGKLDLDSSYQETNLNTENISNEEYENSPLLESFYYAVLKGRHIAIRYIINNLRTPEEWQLISNPTTIKKAIYLAAANGHIEVLREIFKGIASPKGKSKSVEYSNQVALVNNQYGVLLANIDSAQNEERVEMIKRYGYALLLHNKNHIKMLNLLLEKAPENNRDEIINEFFHSALNEKDVVLIKLFLEFFSEIRQIEVIKTYAHEVYDIVPIEERLRVISYSLYLLPQEHRRDMIDKFFLIALVKEDLEMLKFLMKNTQKDKRNSANNQVINLMLPAAAEKSEIEILHLLFEENTDLKSRLQIVERIKDRANTDTRVIFASLYGDSASELLPINSDNPEEMREIEESRNFLVEYKNFLTEKYSSIENPEQQAIRTIITLITSPDKLHNDEVEEAEYFFQRQNEQRAETKLDNREVAHSIEWKTNFSYSESTPSDDLPANSPQLRSAIKLAPTQQGAYL